MAKLPTDCPLVNLYTQFRLVNKNHKCKVSMQMVRYHYATQVQVQAQPQVYYYPYEPAHDLVTQLLAFITPDLFCLSPRTSNNHSFLVTTSAFAVSEANVINIGREITKAEFVVALAAWGGPKVCSIKQPNNPPSLPQEPSLQKLRVMATTGPTDSPRIPSTQAPPVRKLGKDIRKTRKGYKKNETNAKCMGWIVYTQKDTYDDC